MASTTIYGWHLGVLPSIEPAGDPILGTYGGPGDKLANHAVAMTADDGNNDSWISEDISLDRIVYDLGGGPVSETIRETGYFSITYTLTDGSIGTANVWIVQLQSGRTFLLDDEDPNTAALNTTRLQSVEITAYINGNWTLAPGYHSNAIPLCFQAGTRLRTPQGLCDIARLRPGDLVNTLDHGPQPLRWVGRLDRDGLREAPVKLRPGPLGNARALVVTPAHRLMIAEPLAELLWGAHEVLVPARALVGTGLATPWHGPRRPFFHVLFDRHEIVWAENVRAESLWIGRRGSGALHGRARGRFRQGHRVLCRPALSVAEARVLLNAMPRASQARPAPGPSVRSPRNAPPC